MAVLTAMLKGGWNLAVAALAGAALSFAATVQAESVSPAPEPLLVVAPPDDLSDYREFLGGRSPLAIDNFAGPHGKRTVTELVLLHQALHLGGFDWPIELQPVADYQRTLALLRQGLAGMRGLSVWREDVATSADNLLISEPLFRDGEYMAGLYTRADNKTALAARSLLSLRQLKAVSNRNWTVDWRTLTSMGLSQLYHNGHYQYMVQMVYGGRADFLLAPFPAGSDLTLHEGNVTLVPIPNIKVALAGSRHWVASRSSGATAFAALERGLAQLRTDGRVVKAFTEAGVFNAAVADWEVINWQ